MKKLLLILFVIPCLHVSGQLDYKDVAGIFYARCGNCHNQYSHGPSYINYSSTLPWINDIEANLLSGRMPPWTPDTNYTRFIHENKILPSEKTAILDWIAAGALKGDTTLAPPAPVFSKYKLNGNPDLELKIPPFNSNAAANDSYVCFSLPTGLTQDRILRAYEIIAGDPHIVHHVVVNIDSTGSTSNDLSGNCFNITGHFSIGGFAPGSPPTVFPGKAPLKMGIRIKAGSKLVMQIHYPAGSAGKPDSTKIRLYFYPLNESGIRNVFVTTPLQNWNLMIPANATRTFTAIYPSSGPLQADISMFATFPHSHKSATRIINYAFKTGDTVPLIRIRKWDFDQQGYYTFMKMPKVSAAHRLFSSHVFQNSGSATIYAGTNTTDEMLFDSFQFLSYQPGDELIDVNALLESDSLLMHPAGIEKLSSSPFYSYAFPNPFNSHIRIGYSLPAGGPVIIEVYSMLGMLLRTFNPGVEPKGVNEITWDGKNETGQLVAAGTYFYVVRSGNFVANGKIMYTGKGN